MICVVIGDEMKIVLASNNQGKLIELSSLMLPLNITVVAQGSCGVVECEEPFTTFIENALHKARHASRETGLPALADDSGLCVPALNGAPGVYSARYSVQTGDKSIGRDTRNNLKLIENLKGIEDRQSYFYTVLVYVRHEHDPQPIIVDGTWWGRIIEHLEGDGGFGYDPCFYVEAFGCTAAQLSQEQKVQLSHRGQAMNKLIPLLKNEPFITCR